MPMQQQQQIYTGEELAVLNKGSLPRHVAIIMDGNRRWARGHAMRTILGHREGADNLSGILRGAEQIGIKVVTVYAFSTENWRRSSYEITGLMNLLSSYLINKRAEMVENGVRLDYIGDISRCPLKVQNALLETKAATAQCEKIELVLAINYGGRDEIVRAASKILADFADNKLTKEQLTEDFFASYLDTAKWQDPDLLIRTSGEQRVSNFLLWQISYTEIFTCEAHWPDFSKRELLSAVLSYQKRQRRKGGA